MKLKRVVHVTLRDVRSGMRDSMILFLWIMPIAMALILLAVAPQTNEITVKFAVTEAVDEGLTDYFRQFGQVIEVSGREELIDRVGQVDEIVGIDRVGPGSEDYGVMLQGNEREGSDVSAAMIIDAYFGRRALLFDVRLDDLGREDSPLRKAGALFVILYALAAPGFMVGLSLVEEKESNTMSALNVSPLTIPELVLGKALFGSLLALAQMYLIIFILGITPVHLVMVLAMWIPGLLSGLILGFLIGVAAKDQVSAIGMMKFSFLPLIVSFAGSLFIPTRWQFVLWWSPFYWMYQAFNGIFSLSVGWGEFGLHAGLTLLLSVLFLAAASRKISHGLRSM
jgi:ABC-2 type transport system permease protein